MKGTRLVLDTSAYSGFNRGDKRLKEFFHSDNEIFIPLIVLGELRAGFSLGIKSKEDEALLQRFLDSSNVGTITATDKTTRLFRAVFQQLKLAGTPININDIWIAALALEHDRLLVVLDSDFKRVPDLLVAEL